LRNRKGRRHGHDHHKDGTEIYYKDWGTGQPVVFSHGWPLSADAWEDQMIFLAGRGYHCIAHDRRSHGRSSQTWDGNDMNTYADDLAALVQHLDLKSAIHVGHSTGGGEVARYIGRHGTRRVAKSVLIGAIPPLMLKTAANPGGLPWTYSTASAPACSPTARSSSRT
jgi:non-heme chloroperoxidase